MNTKDNNDTGGRASQHDYTFARAIRVKSGLKAGGISRNHNQVLSGRS
jgi:hypothetical protein